MYIDAAFVDAFNNRTIQVDSRPIEEYQAYGYKVGAFYNYPLKKVDLRLGAGYKQLFFSGRYQSTNLSGTGSKAVIHLHGLYAITDTWKGGIGIEMENNRDFDDFRTQTSDLFRYSLKAVVNYKLSDAFSITLDYHKLLNPYSDYYLLTNPSDQLNIGVNYKLPWL